MIEFSRFIFSEMCLRVAVYKSLGLGPKEKHEATNFGFAKVTNTNS